MNSAKYIINILAGISMNTLPDKVKLFVQNCDPSAHQYDQCTLIGIVSDLAPTRIKDDLHALIVHFFLELLQIDFPDEPVADNNSTLIHIPQEKLTTKAIRLGLYLQNDCGDKQYCPCWIYGPGMIYFVLKYPDFKKTLKALMRWCTPVTGPGYFGRCVLQLSPTKIQTDGQSSTYVLQMFELISKNFLLPDEVTNFLYPIPSLAVMIQFSITMTLLFHSYQSSHNQHLLQQG